MSGPPPSAPGPRERILARVRSGLEGRLPVSHPGQAPGQGSGDGAGPGGEEKARRFAAALARSGAALVVLEHQERAAAWLAEAARGFGSVAVGRGVAEALRPPLPEAPPEEAQLGVSQALCAAADTGTLLLPSPEGRRVQLLPPVHLVWVWERRLFPDLGRALSWAREQGPLPATLALHSGPSKSADIGRILVTGVHGPGRVLVALARFELPRPPGR